MTISKRLRDPAIYEINAWVWLSDLSQKTGTFVDLSSVPSADWDNLAKFGFDAVKLMRLGTKSSGKEKINPCCRCRPLRRHFTPIGHGTQDS
jgi:hypothetical protein